MHILWFFKFKDFFEMKYNNFVIEKLSSCSVLICFNMPKLKKKNDGLFRKKRIIEQD